MTKIKLINFPVIDSNYANVIDFANKSLRDEYFRRRQGLTIEKNIKSHSNISLIALDIPIEQIDTYDYLIVDDKFFYFITDKEMINLRNTNIYIKLDVFNTYYYNVQLLPSFVDRCHVPRWNGDTPTYNMEEETIGIGEYILKEQEEIYTMKDNMIVTTSVPIGFVNKPNNTGGDGTSWENGKLSAKGFRFVKGYEGFAPSSYQDTGGYWTIGYGITKHGELEIYNDLVSKSPLQEETAARVAYDVINSRYGIKILDSVRSLGCNNQNQFDALCSLAYNSGNGSITGNNELTRIIAEDPNNESTIRPVWESYKTNGGLPGLVARRKQECDLYFGIEFTMRTINTINTSGNIDGTVTENNGDGWLPSESQGEVNGYKVHSNAFGEFMCPVKTGTVTSKYGWRIHPITGVRTFHHGTDIGLPTGSPTVASMNGTITSTGFSSSMGNYIYLDNGTYRVKYMHLSKIQVDQGATVKMGTQIGEIGTTGNSTGPHCHWEIRRLSDDESTDPAPTLNKGDIL